MSATVIYRPGVEIIATSHEACDDCGVKGRVVVVLSDGLRRVCAPCCPEAHAFRLGSSQ